MTLFARPPASSAQGYRVCLQRDFDLVLQGATGFTGRLAAAALANFAPPGLRWAVAGRNPNRLQAIADRFQVPRLLADARDLEAVDALASRTRVVISCAGPFALFGTPLVEACVHHRTHYADLTGELPWVRAMVDQHHEEATRTDTVLLPACGFDSAPTDLCVQQFLTKLPVHDPQARSLTGLWTMRGGINGGTLASGLHLYRHWKTEEFQHPFYLDPDPEQSRRNFPLPPPQPSVFPVPAMDRWGAPFLMAPVNERVVRRTAALTATTPSSFSYREFMTTGSRFKAKGMATLLQLSESMMSHAWGRALLRTFGPKPGQGPSDRARARAFARLDLIAGSLESPDLHHSWDWPGDASNEITVRCLTQAGLALAAGEAPRGGVLTPASALGPILLRRLLSCGAVSLGKQE